LKEKFPDEKEAIDRYFELLQVTTLWKLSISFT
jgi:hypothetical protein